MIVLPFFLTDSERVQLRGYLVIHLSHWRHCVEVSSMWTVYLFSLPNEMLFQTKCMKNCLFVHFFASEISWINVCMK